MRPGHLLEEKHDQSSQEKEVFEKLSWGHLKRYVNDENLLNLFLTSVWIPDIVAATINVSELFSWVTVLEATFGVVDGEIHTDISKAISVECFSLSKSHIFIWSSLKKRSVKKHALLYLIEQDEVMRSIPNETSWCVDRMKIKVDLNTDITTLDNIQDLNPYPRRMYFYILDSD